MYFLHEDPHSKRGGVLRGDRERTGAGMGCAIFIPHRASGVRVHTTTLRKCPLLFTRFSSRLISATIGLSELLLRHLIGPRGNAEGNCIGLYRGTKQVAVGGGVR